MVTTFREGHWIELVTDLEVWLHDRKCEVDAGFYVQVEKLHGDGRVTVRNSGNYFTLSVAMLERIKRKEN